MATPGIQTALKMTQRLRPRLSQRRRPAALLVVVLLASLIGMLALAVRQPQVPASETHRDAAAAAFTRTWERTDRAVSEQVANRTWMWGPAPLLAAFEEPYADAFGGTRWVRYYDKARMELPDPDADPASTWYVTNGLIARELITGQLQLGDALFEQRNPASQNVAGDANDTDAPTYASFGTLLDVAPHANNAPITERLLRDGSVQVDDSLAQFGATYAMRVQVEAQERQIASPFWAFVNSSGPVYEQGLLTDAPLFENPFYATGLPLTEPYWTRVLVGGQTQDVLVQCFERRCLTWTPTNPEGFRTESANVGLHYYTWRYGAAPGAGPTAEPSPTPTLTLPPTATPSTVAEPTSTPITMPVSLLDCPDSGEHVVRVRNGDDLRDAIAVATPGTTISLADGTYAGPFEIHRSGTASAPITLCGAGGGGAVLLGKSVQTGDGISVHADYWHISGLTITRFLKGVEAHGATGLVLRGLEIHNIGQEGIHLRDLSSNNIVEWNRIFDTGRYKRQWGEGIYIGSDSNQWCDPDGDLGDCTQDASDGNVLQFNTIGPGVPADLIDAKEGTSGGVIRGNILYGDDDPHEDIDALVSIKGNGWLIIGNRGEDAPEHGMRVNTDDLSGWGTGNVFIDNVLDVQASGYGFRLPFDAFGLPLDNTVACANTVTNANDGFANVACTPDVSVP